MTLDNIFSGGRGNAVTTLTAAYVAGTTATISVGDATKLPAAPNIVTILDPELLGNRYVVVQYTGISGNVLTGLTVNDGVPDALQTFGIGSIVTREITRDEWDTIKDHIQSHAARHMTGAEDPISVATPSIDGLMSGPDKIKLDGIESGAQVNKIEKIYVDGTEMYIAGKNINIPEAGVGSGVIKGTFKYTLDSHLASTDNPHATSKSQVGLGNVDNTSDADKPLSSAAVTALAGKASLAHASQHADGGADEINIDASQVNTGIFDIDRIPLAAVPKCHVVADDTARFALTTAQVQNGDTVKVTSTMRMYAVIDDTHLGTEAGYTEYKAATDWTTITGKPASYPPSAHAASHGVAGGDPITVGAAQLSGVVTPKAAFTWVEDDATVSNTVNFTDASTTGTLPITSRYWDFGDGSYSTEQNPSHTYAGFGIYQVSLTVANSAGQGTITKSVTVVSAPIYGYRIIDIESGPAAKVEYIEACAGFTPVTYNPTTKVIDFGSWGPTISETLHPSVLLTGAPGYKDLDTANLALYSDATPSPLDLVSGNVADGDVCLRISHLRFEQILRVGNNEEHRLCSKQPDPSYVARAHTFGDEVRKNAFLGMFEGVAISSTLYSRYTLDTFPTASTKQDTYRSYTTLEKKGAATYGLKNMHLDDLHTSLSVLFLKTLNFQAAIGNGNSTSDAYLKAGEGLNLTGGMLQGDTTSTDTGVMIFWVWNKYANYWEDVDGFVKIEDGKYWVNRTNKDFLNIEALPAVCPGNYDEVLLPTPASGYVRRMSGDSRAPLIPIATGSDADSTHHYCDNFYKEVGVRKLIRGGNRYYGAYCGPFYSYMSGAPDSSGSSIVARLQGFLAAE